MMCNCDLDEKLRADRIEREAGEKYSKLFDKFTDAHAALRETREALRALLRFEPDDLADRLKPDRQAWWAARRVVATGLDTQWAQKTYASPLPDADWTLCAADVVQAQLSVSLSRHVPGWPGATDEQLAAVAREIVNALDQGRDGPGKPQNR